MSQHTCPDCGRSFDSEAVYDTHRSRVNKLGYDPDSTIDSAGGNSPEARRYRAGQRRKGREENKRASDIYRQGVKDERTKTKARRQQPKRRPPAHRRRSSSKTARELKKGAGQLAQPMRAQIGSGIQFLGLSLAVAALYLVLTAEEQTGTFSKALGGLQRALRWLSDPTASIPFGAHDTTE